MTPLPAPRPASRRRRRRASAKGRRRLVQHEDLWRAHQRPREGQHLALAARKPPREESALTGEIREQRIKIAQPLPSRHFQDGGSEIEIVFDREVDEHVVRLRHEAEPFVRKPMGRASGDLAPVQNDPAAGDRHEPRDRLDQGRLPGPFGPRTAGSRSARRPATRRARWEDPARSPLLETRPATPSRESPPRYASTTRGSTLTSCAVPVVRSRPAP